MFNKILYFGAGTHLKPIKHLPETKEFVFGDSQPKTEFGCLNVYKREFYRKFFMFELEDKIKEFGLSVRGRKILTNKYPGIFIPELESECLNITNKPYNLRSATNIKYYISTSLPYDLYDNVELQSDIETCDTLLISGHHPHIKIIDYIKKPFNLIGYSGTWFPASLEKLIEEDYDYKDNVFFWILSNIQMIKSMTVINEKTGEKYFCDSYKEFCDKVLDILYN